LKLKETKRQIMLQRRPREENSLLYIDVEVNMSKMEMKSIIKQCLKKRWQKQWEEEKKGQWFSKIQRKVGEMRCTGRKRRDETINSDLGIQD